MHAHWLPGLDDGAPDLTHSLDLLRRLAELGYQRLWATPHVMADLYPNTVSDIQERLAMVQAAATEAGLQLELGAAAEYLLDEAFGEKIASGALLTLPGQQVLVEMSFVSPAPQLDTYIFRLQTQGYRVILAHPERYRFYHQNFAAYRRLVDKGVSLQLNLLSLTGYYGNAVREVAWRLLQEDLVTYLGTDLHHERHAEQLSQLLTDRKLNKLLHHKREQLRNTALV